MAVEYPAGTASNEALAAEAAAGQRPVKTAGKSTKVKPLSTADIAPKKAKTSAAKKVPAAKSVVKKAARPRK